MITTTRGLMDETLLDKREGTIDNANELTKWVEYWQGEELLHRSAHVTLKAAAVAGTDIGVLGNG